MPADRTTIEALREAGIDLVTSGEQGICGTCLARVVEGEPDHRGMYLSDEEREKRLFARCVSLEVEVKPDFSSKSKTGSMIAHCRVRGSLTTY